MSVIDYAEQELIHYGAMKRSVRVAEFKISKILEKYTPSELRAVKMDITGVRGSGNESNTIDAMLELQHWTEIKNENESELKFIDSLLKEIDKESDLPIFEVISLWYIKKKKRDEIAEILKCSVPQVYKVKTEGIRLFAISMYGKRAVGVI